MFAGLFLFYFIFDDYLVLENQGTEQIILDVWEKIWKHVVKIVLLNLTNIVNLGLFPVPLDLFFSATIFMMKWSLHFILYFVKKLTIYILFTVFECWLNYTFFNKKNA